MPKHTNNLLPFKGYPGFHHQVSSAADDRLSPGPAALKKKERARIEIQPRFKIQYPMKNHSINGIPIK